jgi:hypothetical protein
VSFATLPTTDEIIRLHEAGELLAEVARYHGTAENEDDQFIRDCVALHNEGKIDLVSLPNEAAFAGITGHEFFIAQHFYCEAIPKLKTDAIALMQCCQKLVDQAGADLAAGAPNGAFHIWCQNNPKERAKVIDEARAGGDLAKQFVTFALQASDDMDLAIDFVRSYADDRRLSGMTALARLTFADAAAAQKAIAVLEPFIAASGQDHIRANALLAAFEVLNRQNDPEASERLIRAAAVEPDRHTLHGLAQIVSLRNTSLTGEGLRTALLALQAVKSEHVGTLRLLDLALHRLLGTVHTTTALDFLAAVLREGELAIQDLQATVTGPHRLVRGEC